MLMQVLGGGRQGKKEGELILGALGEQQVYIDRAGGGTGDVHY